MDKLDSTDLVLLMLWAPTRSSRLDKQVPGITRLEKLLFLLDREADAQKYVDAPFTFRPYDFGPYSKEVYEAVEVLEAAGLVDEDLVYSGDGVDTIESHIAGIQDEPEGAERRFRLTEAGEDVAQLLARQAPQELIDKLSEIKNRYGGLPLRNLIHYVYSRYPAFAERSKIRDEVVGD
jgi:hypothetical protein